MSEFSEKSDGAKRADKRGILRLDITKPRNSSGSVEFRNQPELISEASPSLSTQLSVKWAFPNDINSKAENASDVQLRSDRVQGEKRAKKTLSADYFGFQPYYDQFYMEPDVPEYINSEDEDYSLSLSAVIQRRASVRGRKKGYYSPRRASSPMAHSGGVFIAGNSIAVSKADRRRSSVYTTSSGETVVSLGDGANNQESTKEQIFENIRLHKEVLQSVKMQPWSMRRKLRLVRQAREYIARHEGALQERFAMSRSTKDLWARFRIVLTVKWQHFRRELVNLSTLFVPWQLRIKEIESHFGSVVASYFTFLRWLFWVNIVLAFALSTFVILPEFIASQYEGQNDHRKIMLEKERQNATRLTTFLNFEGFLKYSPLFYGYYSDYSGINQYHKYNLPLAYFFAGISVYIYSFWATLRKMADNSRMSKMSSKEDECIFSWKLFTGWDYMIGHAETAHNRIASVVLSFKEALLEEAEKKKEKQNWEIIVRRIFVNIVILCLLVLSATAVVIVVKRSSVPTKDTSYWRQNETSFVMTGISFFFPTCFEILGMLEKYHPRKQLRWQLGRIMLLNLLNLFSLIIALFNKIDLMNRELRDLRHCGSTEKGMLANGTANGTVNGMTILGMLDETTTLLSTTITATASELVSTAMPHMTELSTWITSAVQENVTTTKQCVRVLVNCSSFSKDITSTVMTTLFTVTILPAILNHLNATNHTNMTNSTFDADSFNSGFLELIYYEGEKSTEYPSSSSSDPLNSTITTLFDSTTPDYETTTQIDDYGTYDDEDETEGERVRRQVTNLLYEMQNGSEFSYDNTSDTESFANATNLPEWLSSTVTSFLENTTLTLDPSDVTSISEQWTDYISKMTTEYDSDQESATYMPDECIDNPDGAYFKVTCPNTTDDTTTPMSIEGPAEMRALSPDVRSSTIFIDTTVSTVANELSTKLPSNSTINPSNSTNLLNSSMCVPFSRTKANNITGVAPEYEGTRLTKTIRSMTNETQEKLRDLCWETLFGQELVKLTVLDLIFTIFATLFMDFFRALFVRFMNKCWCWDLEKKFPKYGDFKIAENILHLVNNQGQVWMGMFFAPGLAILNLFKLGILMYFRSWSVLTCNVPHEVIFRASRSNNFYLALLLTMLFLCVLPVSYAIVWIEPSWHCGPFAHHERIYRVFTDTLKETLPDQWYNPILIIGSPSTVIPLLLLLILIIYYLLSLTGALREANQDLKNQLRRERQEERRKMLQRVVNAKLDDSGGNNAIDRWRKVLEASSPVTPNAPGQPAEPDEDKMKARREFLARIMKKALRKSSNTSEEESHVGDDGDETDTEQHEQLPHDQDERRTQDVVHERRAQDERRTPPKRRPSVHLLDEKRSEQLQQPSQQPRKMSFNRMRDIAEVSRRRPEPIVDQPKLQKPRNTVAEKRREKENLVESAKQDDDCSKMSVVSERRALRRQQNAHESDNLTLQPAILDAAKYDLAAEKSKTERMKSPPINTSPEIFKFDAADDAVREYSSSKEMEESDTDQTSYKEIVSKPIKSKLSKDSSSSLLKNASPTTSRQLHSPKAPDDNASDVSTARKSDKEHMYSPSPQQSPSPSDKLKQTDDILNKPIRKLNSFLALVKEAVQAKRQESIKDANDTPDIQARVKTFIDDSNSVSMSESVKTNTDSVTTNSSKNTTYFESIRRKRHAEPPNPKRQDSQASIWSENIPVITISKSESDECILERDNDECRADVKPK